MLCPVGDDAYIVPFDALLRADVGIRPYDMAIVSSFDAKKRHFVPFLLCRKLLQKAVMTE